MKELSIEQKAKRYDEALERARKELQICGFSDCDAARQIFRFFPELKENEDERIRKAILGLVMQSSEILGNQNQSNMITWLEKQDIFSKKDVDDAYLKGISDAKNEIEKQYEANYQIRKDIATFIFNYRGDLKDRAKWMNYLGIKVSFVKNQDEQNPQPSLTPKSALEAAKEKKVDNQNCVNPTDKNEPKFHEGEPENYKQQLMSEITDLVEDYISQKPTWSEEDEKKLSDIISILRGGENCYYNSPILIDWLKSFKERIGG